MVKIKIFTIGKVKEIWLTEALGDYTRRLQGKLSIEWILAKDDEQLVDLLKKESSFIALDEKGESYSSIEFAALVEKGGARLNFVIGGADGLPKEIVERSSKLLSLSAMTFTHQIARLVLLEQLYRASEILKNSPYHRT